jgi:hypothetical protein
MVDGHDIVQTSTTDRDVQNNLQLNREMNVNRASDNVNVHNLEVVSNNVRISLLDTLFFIEEYTCTPVMSRFKDVSPGCLLVTVE